MEVKCLPVIEQRGVVASRSESQWKTMSSAMSKQTILVIDDDLAQHEILEEHLSLAGFSPLHANSSDEGLTLLKDNDISLILLDINMPEVDGFQTIEILRNNPQTSEVPVLFLTSLDRQYLKVKGLDLGADDYITKPFNGTELIARIKGILRRKEHNPTQQSALSGDIREIGFGDLLQNISQSGKDGKIEFSDMDGELTVSGDIILSARQGKHGGMEALLRLILLEHGHFTVSYEKIPELDVDKGIPVIKILLTVLNEIGEIKKAIKETTIQKDPFLEIVDTISGEPDIDKLRSRLPCRFLSFAAAMEGPLKENVYKLLKAIHTRKIRPVID